MPAYFEMSLQFQRKDLYSSFITDFDAHLERSLQSCNSAPERPPSSLQTGCGCCWRTPRRCPGPHSSHSEHEKCIEKYGATPAQLLDKYGVWQNGGIAAHCVYLSGGVKSIKIRSAIFPGAMAPVSRPRAFAPLMVAIARMSGENHI